MTSIVSAVILLPGNALMTGCAAPCRPDELVRRTGSRIPIRDATPMTKEEKERQAQESQPAPQQMQSTGAGNPRNN